MELKNHFEERFEELKSEIGISPWLDDCFFLIYQLPNGRFSEVLNKKRNGAESEMEKEATGRITLGTTMEYMCRRLGKDHIDDDYKPQRWAHKG